MSDDNDEVTAEAPSDPAYREGVSIWVWDDAGRFCFPRIGVEAVGAKWSDSFETAVCMARPDGTLLLVSAKDAPLPVADAQGRPRVLGAGALVFECVEPFDTWRVDFDGGVVRSDVERYLTGGVAKLRLGSGLEEVDLRVSIEARQVAPPWFQGTREPEGFHVVGERRFEQLCAVTGTLAVDGGESTSFRGGGLRIHRKGGNRNDYGDFHGHTWASAWFPSGRAFGFIHYRSGPDGAPRYREGWLLEGDEVVAARVEGTPWLRDVTASGEDVSFTLRTATGEVTISGTTFASSFRPPRPTTDDTTFPLLHSAIARYRWDHEEAFGMIERSSRLAGQDSRGRRNVDAGIATVAPPSTGSVTPVM